jgi:[ribosomal protein S18]-alanine N-acetyltransferase
VIHLQQFKPKDMFDVLKLASKVLSEQYNPTLFNYLYESCPWGFWTAHFHQRLVGFIIGVAFSDNFAKILMIGVSSSMQKRGVGSMLLSQLLTEFTSRNISIVELEVAVSNTKAVAFYQKHDFKITERWSSFYQNGEDAFVMRWNGPH